MTDKTEKAPTFKEGDKVVITEAYPPIYNGKVAIYLYSNMYSHEVSIPNVHNWTCLKIRHATLLEKELAEC